MKNHIKLDLDYEFNLYIFIFLKDQIPSDTDLIDQWLTQVLKIEISEIPKSDNTVTNAAWRILLLARSLFQAVSIPVFHPGDVLKVEYNQKKQQYSVHLKVNTIDSISPLIYKNILNVCSKIFLDDFKKPLLEQNTQELYTYLNQYILQPFKEVSGSGKSTMPVLKAAYDLNIPFTHLGAGVYQLGWGSKARRFDRSAIQYDSAIGAILSQRKMLASNLIRRAGLPAPVNILVRKPIKRDVIAPVAQDRTVPHG